jgi:DNA-binding NarL/FixJ family response regulator
VRVALAEDGALFRDGLVMLLEAAGHDVVGCTADGDSLVRLLASEPADVAILDIRMPPEPDGGLVTAERLRAAHPKLGLLFLSHYAEAHYLMRVLRIGTEAIGYRLKEKVGSVDVLGDTLDRIRDGEIVIEPMLARRLVDQPAGHRRDVVAALSPRELDVLRLMAEGRSNGGIGRRLWITQGTVERHVHSIMLKLGLPESDDDHRRVLAAIRFLEAHQTGSSPP